MVGDTFWNTQVPAALRPGANDPVLYSGTTGDAQPDAIPNMPGATGGAVPTGFKTGAQAVYPIFGTTGNAMPTPVVPQQLAKFNEWHSGYQAEHIRANGPHVIVSGGQTVGHFVLIRNDTYPVNLVNMTLAEYAMLTDTEKTALGSTLRDPAIGVATRLQLTNDKAPLVTALQQKINFMNSNPLRQPAGHALTSAQITALFTSQIQMILDRVNSADMVISTKILQEAGKIEERFKRAKAFSDTHQARDVQVRFYNQDGGGYDAYTTGVQAQTLAVSSDNNVSINAGYSEFIRAEQTILTQQRRRDALSNDTSLRDPKMDVANLIYQLQMLYEAEAEGIADSGTEEIKQLHKLLQDYGIMQQMLNETLKTFDQSDQNQKRRFMNMGGRVDADKTVQTNQHSSDNASDDTGLYYWVYNSAGSLIQVESPGHDSNSDSTYEQSPGYHWILLQASGVGGTVPGYADNDQANRLITSRWSRAGDNNAGKINGGLSAEQMRVFSMFSDDNWAKRSDTRQKHPLEAHFGLGDRPVQLFTAESDDGDGSLALLRYGEFNGFLTQLNDFVTQMNQKSQIKQNEIESASRRQNRHFDLGNNALRKMNDMLMTIGRM